MNKYVVDTSFISSLVFRNDVNFKKANVIYKNIYDNAIFIVPSCVILEFLIGVKKFFPRKVDFMYKYVNKLAEEIIYIDKKFLDSYSSFIKKEKHLGLSTMDMSILVSARNQKAKILTFDIKLEKFSRKLNTQT